MKLRTGIPLLGCMVSLTFSIESHSQEPQPKTPDLSLPAPPKSSDSQAFHVPPGIYAAQPYAMQVIVPEQTDSEMLAPGIGKPGNNMPGSEHLKNKLKLIPKSLNSSKTDAPMAQLDRTRESNVPSVQLDTNNGK